jgi:hypothetical protein
MFRIVCDPSSGSIELYFTEIRSGSLMFVVCLIGVWQRNFEPVVCVCVYGTSVWELLSSSQTDVPYTHTHTTGSKLRCQTPIKHTTNISEPLRISVKNSCILPDDGSHTIRNMSEWFLILCLLKLLYNVDFNF